MNRLLLYLGCLTLTGCAGMIGPSSIPCDSVNYNHAVQNSNDTQLLLNMVRLRYRDTPTFLQVGQVSAAYDYRRSLSAKMEFRDGRGVKFSRLFSPSASLDLSERPTTIYHPLKGGELAKEMMAPISLQTLSLLSSSGWRIDRILRCCVQRMNRVLNAPSASGPTPYFAPDYEEFIELADIFRQLELHNLIDIIVQKGQDCKEADFYLIIDKDRANPNLLNRMWTLLDLDLGTSVIKLIPSRLKKHGGNEIMIETRSPLGLFYFLSQGVRVPHGDEKKGLVTVTQGAGGEPFSWERVLSGIMDVHWASRNPPCDGVKVDYRGREFFICDRDLDSKATFSMITQLLSLQTQAKELATVLTIPLND